MALENEMIWQSIETAPKDKKPILVYILIDAHVWGSVRIARWHSDNWRLETDGNFRCRRRVTITHWMSLPEPPK
jgi:hypothetical protein